MKKQLIVFWLDFVNNFLTVKNYAEYHGIPEYECSELLKIGKTLNEL
jgi:hypothetical protein